MNLTVCGAALVAASFLLSASTASAEDMCKSAGDAGRAIMTARQQNADMSVLMAAADKQDEAMKNVARQMIIAAYEQPAYSTEKMQAKAIAEFANNVQLACYKAL